MCLPGSPQSLYQAGVTWMILYILMGAPVPKDGMSHGSAVILRCLYPPPKVFTQFISVTILQLNEFHLAGGQPLGHSGAGHH